VSPPADARQVSLLPPEAAALVHLVRENLRLLAELARRYEVPGLEVAGRGPAIRGPADVAAYFGPELADLAQEQLRVVYLDGKHRALGTALVYQGGLNATVVRLADVFREAVRAGAAAIVLLHNHPSLDPTPSPEDVRLTAEVARAGDLLGIDLLDHLVIGGQRHVSLRASGLYTPAGAESSVAPEQGPDASGPAEQARPVAA
jgi:DNA repair protein RadC